MRPVLAIFCWCFVAATFASPQCGSVVVRRPVCVPSPTVTIAHAQPVVVVYAYLPAVLAQYPFAVSPTTTTYQPGASPVSSPHPLVGDDGPPVVPPAGSAGSSAMPAVLQARCASCHTSPGKGGVDLFPVATVSRSEIYAAVASGRMPKGGLQNPALRLTPDEIESVRQWSLLP